MVRCFFVCKRFLSLFRGKKSYFVADTAGLWQFSCFHRFDRDWKKIEDFVGSKTVIQV